MKLDSNGFYPLHCAVINNRIDATKLLLNVYACSPNLFDKNMNTSLHFACMIGLIDLTKILIDHPDINLVI